MLVHHHAPRGRLGAALMLAAEATARDGGKTYWSSTRLPTVTPRAYVSDSAGSASVRSRSLR